MAETVSPPAPTEPPPVPAHRDVRVVTPDQLAELRREQQEIYRSLRLKGSGPSQAAREIGIPRSLADEWERAGTAAGQAAGAGGQMPATGQAPSADAARAGQGAPAGKAASGGRGAPRGRWAGAGRAASADAARAEGREDPPGQAAPADPGRSSLPARDRNGPGAVEIRRLVDAHREAREAARRARACAERLEHELALLREHIDRIEAARDGASPSGEQRLPSRAARSSLTAVLLARGRARQHPPPAPRG